MFDHMTRTAKFFSLGRDVSLAEMCFVPRGKDAPEGDGYLIGVASHPREGGRADLVLVDTQHLEDGPDRDGEAAVPDRRPDHGFWVPGDQLPAATST